MVIETITDWVTESIEASDLNSILSMIMNNGKAGINFFNYPFIYKL